MNIQVVAYVVNAHLPQPGILFDVAYEINGEWFTNNDTQLWPFWTCEINTDDVIMPEGWIEHLHAEARAFASAKPSPKEDRVSGTSLLASLGLPTKIHSAISGTLKRRI